MATIQIDDQTWDLHDAAGMKGRSAAAVPPGAALPAKWRLFGLWGPQTTQDSADGDGSIHDPGGFRRDPAIEAWAEALTAIPDSVTLAGVERTGQDVTLSDNTLDVDELFGGHDQTVGHQAFAIGELTADGDGELAIGCGSDWWMQLWLDGKPVFDTLARGNHEVPVTHDNHVVRLPLTAGRHLLTVRLISGMSGR